jgi:hypothetical protein
LVEEDGGPLIWPRISETELNAIDATCRKLYRFLNQSTSVSGPNPADEPIMKDIRCAFDDKLGAARAFSKSAITHDEYLEHVRNQSSRVDWFTPSLCMQSCITI